MPNNQENKVTASHAIAIGSGITVDNDYEIAVCDGKSGTLRTVMTPEEYAVISEVLKRTTPCPT